jgi:hypothetical protein
MNLASLRIEANEYCGVDSFPEPASPDLRVLWKRKFEGYEEWRIDYQVETSETMPVEAGRRVPAYLLIPRKPRSEALPAVICFHQCALNCTIGKDAVVGKIPWSYELSDQDHPNVRIAADRLDQTYGHDLVHQGFVVLAPDSVNCGERNIETIREEGQTRPCWDFIDDALGRSWSSKATYDAMRAVDLLISLDFVDSERIGAVGHSMGAGYVFRLMIMDERVRGGIASGYAGDEHGIFLPLVSPRLLITLMGAFDGEKNLAKAEAWNDEARRVYKQDGAAQSILLLTGQIGHRFQDQLKWKAYKSLKHEFGMLSTERVSLSEIMQEAWNASRWMLEEEQMGAFPTPKLSAPYEVVGNREDLLSTFAGLFLHMSDQGSRASLQVSIDESDLELTVSCQVQASGQAAEDSSGAAYQTIREIERILFEHCGTLTREHSEQEVIYRIVFKKGSPDV